MKLHAIALLIVLLTFGLSGCATVQPGSQSAEVQADRKRLREWERDNSNEKGPAPTVREKYRRAPKPDFLKN